MTRKPKLKEKAIKLRKEGLTYSEILKKVPVAKSTLSLWLRDVGLSERQKQKITDKKLKSARKGVETIKRNRKEKTRKIKNKSKKEVDKLIKDSEWVSGVILYWAEGTKQKKNAVSRPTEFGNSDAAMIKLFINWLEKYLNISHSRMSFRLFIHENADTNKALKFWSDVVDCKEDEISVYFKKHNPKTNRKYKQREYNGLLSVRITKSTDLNRKIEGWIEGLCERWGVV